ncbi:MAG: hypothetical protein IK032_07825 [Bacteroidales bacterium]|nr:hypothetical protein [Bacteroidales bacterium]MBR5028587.1 hypothetical protein [Bacteroidales bacterium]
MGKTIKKMIYRVFCRNIGHERTELTIGIFRQVDELEYESMSSDRENLSNDFRNIGSDLWTGINECKERYNIEFV